MPVLCSAGIRGKRETGCFPLVQVQEEDEDAELSEVYPRRHRRSNPGQKKSRPPKATLPRVSERTVLDAPALIAAEHDDAQLPEQFSSDARDRQPWIEKEEDAPAVHVATAKAWYRSNSRYTRNMHPL